MGCTTNLTAFAQAVEDDVQQRRYFLGRLALDRFGRFFRGQDILHRACATDLFVDFPSRTVARASAGNVLLY
jgi:hypothetical protein